MKKMSLVMVAAATLLMSATGAMAAQRSKPQFGRSNAGAYLGGALGLGSINYDCTEKALGNSVNSSISCKKNDFAFKLYGGYKFASNFAVEGAYTNFGRAKLSATTSGFDQDNDFVTVKANIKQKFSAFSVLGAYTFVIAPQFSITPKAGLAIGQVRGFASKTSAAPYLGSTFSYAITPKFAVNGIVDLAFIKTKVETVPAFFFGSGVSYQF